MAWQTVENRLAAPKRKPAAMRLGIRGEADKPTCFVTLRSYFADSVGWQRGDAFGLQIGVGDDAGGIRIVRLNNDGANPIGRVVVLAKGGLSFNLGHVPQLGEAARASQATEARMIDADTVEVVIPNWADVEDRDDPDTAVPAAAPNRAAPRLPAKANGALTLHGVSLDLTPDEENIGFKKKIIDLTTRQAALAALAAVLLRVYPNFVDRRFLANRTLADVPKHAVETSLDLIVRDLDKALPGIGLHLKQQKGVGIALAIEG